ncbi:MAG: hypothetical protein QOI11_850 [Candidatus Eremiobacteraeota bacterium]|nr:hypothetical protein [Candidatus Eremiobacteraeota bacterium]
MQTSSVAAYEREIAQAVSRLVAEGVIRGAQVSVRARDGVRLDVAAGVRSDGAPLTADTRLPIFCLTKTLTALAVLDQCERRGIGLDTRASDVLPEFGRNGKRAVPLGELLSNTAGLDETAVPGCRDGASGRTVYEAVAWAPRRPGWDSAKRARYDYEAAFTVLGVWLERVTGQPYATVIEQALAPLGIEAGVIPFPLKGAGGGVPWAAPRGWSPQTHMRTGEPWRDALGAALSGSPAGGAVASAADLCALWAAINRAGAGDPAAGIAPGVARRMLIGQRGRRFDEQLGRLCDYGYGIMTGLSDYHSWGLPPELTPNSYGHLGLGVCLAAVVPEDELVYAVLLNGASEKQTEFYAQRALASAIWRCIARDAPERTFAHP